MISASFFRNVGITVVFFLWHSINAASKQPMEGEFREYKSALASNVKVVGETFLDTLNRGREISLTDRDFIPIVPESASASDKNGTAEVPNGFRVQCFASSQIERVRAEQKALESKVRYPVYIVFATPYYKLQVGDFVKRVDADDAAAKIKELGYADAWVVRTKVQGRP
jgi:hypothetical protein